MIFRVQASCIISFPHNFSLLPLSELPISLSLSLSLSLSVPSSVSSLSPPPPAASPLFFLHCYASSAASSFTAATTAPRLTKFSTSLRSGSIHDLGGLVRDPTITTPPQQPIGRSRRGGSPCLNTVNHSLYQLKLHFQHGAYVTEIGPILQI
uniref:Uncharacterized protein n=1 Tax=Ananas comosus var. bracteatus TaxID=296719 RepID=A0A6V7PQ88_ANACO|nr:unnamed protein product [Ananas comosus var. bracteatus]